MRRTITAAAMALSVAGCSASSVPPVSSSPLVSPEGSSLLALPSVSASPSSATASAPPSSVPTASPASSASPQDGPFALVHGGQPLACSLGWWTAGRLIVDPGGGTAIVVEGGDFGTEGDTMPVKWWPGYSGRWVSGEVQVLDPAGKLVATTGQRYRLEAAFPFDDGFVTCGGEATALPSDALLADAYLAVVRELDESNAKAFDAFNASNGDLAAGKKLHAAFVSNEQAFIDRFLANTWVGERAPIASRIFLCHSELLELARSTAWAESAAQYEGIRGEVENKRVECAGVANELRVTFGLPELPGQG